jgi:hypothetical protein
MMQSILADQTTEMARFQTAKLDGMGQRNPIILNLDERHGQNRAGALSTLHEIMTIFIMRERHEH